MAIQVMEWGYIEWTHVKVENNPRQNMNIGTVVILPGKHLAEHIHYGQEQMLYVLEGNGIYFINGERKTSDWTEELYDTPESTALSIRMLLKRIAEHLVSYCVFSDARKTLESKQKDIDDARQHGKELEANLQLAQNIVTDLRINHHFLFNTLNCMASMALDKDAYELYDAIIDLSKMFRYTT